MKNIDLVISLVAGKSKKERLNKMAQFLIVTLIAVILLIFAITKLKMHPVLAIFLAALIAGIGYGYGVTQTVSLITGGFGGTMTGTGCVILFGAIIAMGVRDSGAVKSMVNACISIFHGKCLELATGMAGFLMSIPVFGDITGVLMTPIHSILGKRSRRSMSTMAGYGALGTNLTHCMVPPTPGALAMVLLLGANLGSSIVWGTIICLVAYLLTWLLTHKWVEKEFIEPRADFVGDVQPVDSDDYHDLMIKEKGLPNIWLALIPIFVPVILIAAASFASLALPEGSALLEVLNVLGSRDIAMFTGVLLMFALAVVYKDNILKNHEANTGKKTTSLSETIFGSWVVEALEAALMPLMITAMGGAFGAVIKANTTISQLGEALAALNFPGFLFPFLIAALLMAAVGSRTTAGMTAAAIVAPMMSQLGLTPLSAFLLCGAGTMCFSHVNDSGFWIGVSFYNISVKQNFKYCTLLGTIAGVILLVLISVTAFVGLI